jgi:hypothetical protein
MASDKLKVIATKYGVAEDQISAILSALSIKTENPNEVQLKGFERVCELIKGGTPLEKAAQTVADDAKAKTTVKDNSGPVQNMAVIECEAQLKEIAARYSMSDRIPEIITALKLKPESITTEQFEQVRVVCEQVQQGMDLQMVAQGLLDKAKPVPPRPYPGLIQDAVAPAELNGQPSEAATLAGAIAPTNNGSMPGLLAQITPVVNQEQRANIDQVVDVLAPHATPNIVEIAAQEAARQCEGIEAYTRHSLANKIVSSPKMNVDPNAAVVRFHEIIAENKAKRNRSQQKDSDS